jgi:hypothetical protein
MVSLASRRSTIWQQFAARVSFPVYEPSVTLGFAPTLWGPLPCGYRGIETIVASYKKGASKISFAEGYPQICGNAGESTTVGSVDINGVKVQVNVYPGSNGCTTTCTIEDGFTNGFLLYLFQPGPRRTEIQVESSHVSLDDLVSVLRSLVKVVPTRLTLGEGAFRSPTGNLSCAMGVFIISCQSRKLAQTVSMGVDGLLGTCRPGCTSVLHSNWPTLAYGKRVNVGPFRCVSQTSGFTCRVIRSGKGFLIDSKSIRRVGP